MEPRPRLWRTGDNRCLCRVVRRPTCHLSEPRSLVCGARQTIIQSAQLGLCPCLDNALCADGICLWRILRLPPVSAARRLALSLFFIQLALNAAWSWMFFGANNPLLGLINIVAQFLANLPTVVAFHRLDRRAAWCLVPLVGLGCLCGRSQCRDLAVERLIDSMH